MFVRLEPIIYREGFKYLLLDINMRKINQLNQI